MLELLMANGRKKESDAHLLMIESSLAPPNEKREIAVSLKEHIERLFGNEGVALHYYTFLAVFGENAVIPEYHSGIDGAIHIEAPPDEFSKSEWREIRKYLKYMKSSDEKFKIQGYIQSQKIDQLFEYIQGKDLGLENYFDPDERDETSTMLKMIRGFSDRMRRMFLEKEVNISLDYLGKDADYINAGRMLAFNYMFSYMGKTKMYKIGEGFDIDCLCTSYRFGILLDLLHIMNLKNPNTSIIAYQQGNLEFFETASIPIHLGITYDDLKE